MVRCNEKEKEEEQQAKTTKQKVAYFAFCSASCCTVNIALATVQYKIIKVAGAFKLFYPA